MSVLNLLIVLVATHHTQVPKSEYLVLSVRNDISTVALSRNIGDTLSVSNKNAGRFLRIAEGASVPVYREIISWMIDRRTE